MRALAPIVAFEHHLPADGAYSPDVARPSLTLGTMLCGIADTHLWVAREGDPCAVRTPLDPAGPGIDPPSRR
jgi:hypothetical protein